MEKTRLYINSDGTSIGTKIYDSEGNVIGLVQKVTWSIGASDAFSNCVIEVAKVPLRTGTIEATVIEKTITETETDDE